MSYYGIPVKPNMFWYFGLWEEIRGDAQKGHLGSTDASLQKLENLGV